MTSLHDLTPKFRNIRLLLAREKGHPEGDREEGYDVLAPLTDEGRLDAEEWKSHKGFCRVRRFRTGEDDLVGRLRRKPGGQWYFDYAEGDATTLMGRRLSTEASIQTLVDRPRAGRLAPSAGAALICRISRSAGWPSAPGR